MIDLIFNTPLSDLTVINILGIAAFIWVFGGLAWTLITIFILDRFNK